MMNKQMLTKQNNEFRTYNNMFSSIRPNFVESSDLLNLTTIKHHDYILPNIERLQI